MEINYKELYEKEHQKNAALAERVAALEDANGDQQFKIDRIKNNPLWKMSKPARDVMHVAIRQVDRLCERLFGQGGLQKAGKGSHEAVRYRELSG